MVGCCISVISEALGGLESFEVLLKRSRGSSTIGEAKILSEVVLKEEVRQKSNPFSHFITVTRLMQFAVTFFLLSIIVGRPPAGPYIRHVCWAGVHLENSTFG